MHVLCLVNDRSANPFSVVLLLGSWFPSSFGGIGIKVRDADQADVDHGGDCRTYFLEKNIFPEQ